MLVILKRLNSNRLGGTVITYKVICRLDGGASFEVGTAIISRESMINRDTTHELLLWKSLVSDSKLEILARCEQQSFYIRKYENEKEISKTCIYLCEPKVKKPPFDSFKMLHHQIYFCMRDDEEATLIFDE